ncbi:MAG: hypothetical protein ACRERC_10225 [Candidatus Binatia bacterium]
MTRSILAMILAVLSCAGAPGALADSYDYTVDRFELDGNVHGALDGTPDLVEDFDDGTMGPVFTSAASMPHESGGLLHLASPGIFVAIPGVTPVRFETTAVVQNSWMTGIQVGSGDLVARIVMPAQTIGANDAINLLVQSMDDDGLYYAGVSIVNFNTSLATLSDPPVTPGLSIFAHQEKLNYVTGNQQLILEDESIEGAPVTGDIVLELHYDDATETVTPRYSLDGGATFAGSFSPLPIETSSGTATFYLAAVAHEGECPAGANVQALNLRGLGRPGDSRMLLKGSFGLLGRQTGNLQVTITDEGAGGATVLDLHLPDRLEPTCGPSDGWTFTHGLHRYRNYSNALPPDCIPGSAQGLQKWDVRINGRSRVKLKVKDGTLPQVVGPLRLGLYSGDGPVNECDGNVATMSCDVRLGAAHCPQ